jgi:hypothetical protein
MEGRGVDALTTSGSKLIQISQVSYFDSRLSNISQWGYDVCENAFK